MVKALYLQLHAAVTKAETVSDRSVWMVKMVYLYLLAAVTIGRNGVRSVMMVTGVYVFAGCSNKSKNSVRQKWMTGDGGVSVSAGCSNNMQK